MNGALRAGMDQRWNVHGRRMNEPCPSARARVYPQPAAPVCGFSRPRGPRVRLRGHRMVPRQSGYAARDLGPGANLDGGAIDL